MSKSLSPKQKYDDLIKRLEKFDLNLSRAIKAKQILKTADNDKYIKSLDNTYEAHTCSFLLSSARNELILGLRRNLEEGKSDRCSFRRLIKIRTCQNLDDYIRKNIFDLKKLEPIPDSKYKDIKSFKEQYLLFEQRNKDLINDLGIFRNFHIAHSQANPELADFAKERIIFSEMFKLLDELCALFEDFTRLVKIGCWDNTSKNNVDKKHSDLFWKSICEGIDLKKTK